MNTYMKIRIFSFGILIFFTSLTWSYSGTGQQAGSFYYYNDYQASYTIQTMGCFTYVNSLNGYWGTGQRIGNLYYYNDILNNSIVVQTIGNFDYISSTNGYSGTGQAIGCFYYYNDNWNSYTLQTIGNFSYISCFNGNSIVGLLIVLINLSIQQQRI